MSCLFVVVAVAVAKGMGGLRDARYGISGQFGALRTVCSMIRTGDILLGKQRGRRIVVVVVGVGIVVRVCGKSGRVVAWNRWTRSGEEGREYCRGELRGEDLLCTGSGRDRGKGWHVEGLEKMRGRVFGSVYGEMVWKSKGGGREVKIVEKEVEVRGLLSEKTDVVGVEGHGLVVGDD